MLHRYGIGLSRMSLDMLLGGLLDRVLLHLVWMLGVRCCCCHHRNAGTLLSTAIEKAGFDVKAAAVCGWRVSDTSRLKARTVVDSRCRRVRCQSRRA